MQPSITSNKCNMVVIIDTLFHSIINQRSVYFTVVLSKNYLLKILCNFSVCKMAETETVSSKFKKVFVLLSCKSKVKGLLTRVDCDILKHFDKPSYGRAPLLQRFSIATHYFTMT